MIVVIEFCACLQITSVQYKWAKTLLRQRDRLLFVLLNEVKCHLF